MLIVRNIIAVLICISPLALLWDGLVVQGIVSGIAAIAMAVTARSLRPGETEFLISVARPALIAAAIPALWIIVQVLPLGVLAHPIWKSASIALHQTWLGSVSIDPATSIISLGGYLSLAAVAFLSAAVAVDRQRADWILLALSIATSITAVMVLAYQFVSPWPVPFALPQAIQCVSLGTILAAALCVRAFQQYGIRRHQARNTKKLNLAELLTFIPGVGALVLCWLALSFVANREIVFATAYGLVTLASHSVIRRFDFGWWGMAGLAVPALIIAFVLIGSHPTQRDASVPLAFASERSSSQNPLSQRMLDDAPLAGIGAGTFKDLAPVYREIKDPPSPPTAATTAAAFAIELGKPLLWLTVVAVAGFALSLLRASLRRGRDSFYPAMAAGGLVTVSLSAFVDVGLLGTATGLIVSGMLGLGFAQSKSRTVRA